MISRALHVLKARPEAFGAWVELSDHTLVAITQDGARKIGISPTEAAVGSTPRPLEVHLSVTARCPVGCGTCYTGATPDGDTPTFAELRARLQILADAGVFTVAFGGGEPLSRPDLGALAREARRLGLTPVTTTSGLGLTPERARALRDFAQINVSIDGAEAAPGLQEKLSTQAMRALALAQVPFGANVVVTRNSFDRLGSLVELVHRAGGREVQLLRLKPAGRMTQENYLSLRLEAHHIDAFPGRLQKLHEQTPLPIRIDCALVPFLSHLDSLSAPASLLERGGILGCEAGRYLAGIDVAGALRPCSVAEESSAVSADTLTTSSAWSDGPATLRAWRTVPSEGACANCRIQKVCRGGCKVVSSFLGEAGQPDPECPRVRTFASATKG